MDDRPAEGEGLARELSLFDVYAICTGAMFSSGFFLLPGIAAAGTGPSVILAYVLAGVLIVPALLSKAELATAMPRAGGTYFFLDRSMGPLVGTVGGLGTWIALLLKSAFALIGIGAYTAIYLDVPIETIAVVLTVAFFAVNLVGAKESGRAQTLLVIVLLAILGLFLASGGVEVSRRGAGSLREQFTPFFAFGAGGLFATVGLVFVSYAGLTKVASVAEEVENPDRNIPLAMVLALTTTTVIYALGIAVMVAVLDPVEFRDDLTPVATAASEVLGWLPGGGVGVGLVVVAALAASASTANAGIMSASRYPLALARDRLLPDGLARVGKFRTPGRSLLLTSGVVVAIIATVDVENVVKLASAFQLLVFSMVNVAVVVMRESRIPSYVPGFRSPLYPWMQVAGAVIPLWLLVEMGPVAMGGSLAAIVLCAAWYFVYGRDRVERKGAVFHLFRRLGRHRYDPLDRELRQILKERAAEDGAEHAVLDAALARAPILDVPGQIEFEQAAEMAVFSFLDLSDARELEAETPGALADRLLVDASSGAMPVSRGVVLVHARHPGLERPVMLLARSTPGIVMPAGDGHARDDVVDEPRRVHALVFLLSPEGASEDHLRLLAALAARIDRDHFLERWLDADDYADLRGVLGARDRERTTVHTAG